MPEIIDKRSMQDEDKSAPIIVFQHTTFADGYILLYIFGLLRFVVNKKHVSNPIVKGFTDKYGCIPVDLHSRTGVTEKIQEYVQNNDYTQPLTISPEGGTPIVLNSNDILAPFSSGAFVPLVPVQPVLINFTCPDDSEFTNPTWNTERVQKDDNVIKWFFARFFARPCKVHITIMEKASAKEGMAPKEYANDVRNKMIAEITGTTVAVPLKNEPETILESIPESITDIKDTVESDINQLHYRKND
jgi:hypothetical protein